MRIPEDMTSGTVHETNSFGKLEVIEYRNNLNVDVCFIESGYKTTARAFHIRNGNVKDKLLPAIYGVGFIGDGCYVSFRNGKHTNEYICWSGMIERCYSDDCQKRQPTYKGCSVHPDWHNFQTFAKWYHENYPADGGDYHLDKDKSVEGNKVYGPDTCEFLTRQENNDISLPKKYKFKDPFGNAISVINLSKFCKSNNLNLCHMSSVSTGKRKSHKGWRLA